MGRVQRCAEPCADSDGIHLSFAPHLTRPAVVAAICFLYLCSAAEPRQQASHPSAGQSIRATAVAVNVYAIVEGRRGRLIHGLKKDDFELSENGAPQKIEYFSGESNEALSLGVAIDTSASQGRLLGTEKEAAKEFLQSVLRGGDQVFVMSFDSDVKLLKDFTFAESELAAAIDAAEINDTGKSLLAENRAGSAGGTHLYDAVFLASNELMKARQGRKVMVLITDGEDQGSKASLQKAIEAAEKADVIVYSIVVSDPEFYSLMGGAYHGGVSVRTLARETGGRTIRVKEIAQIGAAFEEIAGELRAQYRLSYSPAGLRLDGSFRRISVKVRGRAYTVRTRSGYYDRGDLTAEATPTKH